MDGMGCSLDKCHLWEIQFLELLEYKQVHGRNWASEQ